jgi:AcrR family transcriptional regulator
MNKTRGRGRPAGRTETRSDILVVARRRFLADGYDRVTMRGVAEEAGVDSALISYHFGSKRGLFGAAMALPANPAEILVRELDGPLESLPERLVRAVISAWDGPGSSGSLRTFLEAALREPEVARAFREMMEREMIPRIADRLGGADARRRAALAMSQIAGLVMARYIIGVEPLASMPVDEIVQRTSPALRAALAGGRPRPRHNERW